MEEILFEDWAEEWLQQKRNYVKESTYANYLIMMVNHIIPKLAGRRVVEVNTQLVQNLVLEWGISGKLNQKGGLSIKTIKDMVIILKMCVRDFDMRYGVNTLIQKITYPVNTVNTSMVILSKNEQKVLVGKVLESHELEPLGYAICLYTGIRIGELCALTWGDIDMEEKVIYINKTIQRVYYKKKENRGVTKVIISSPKSLKSIRAIPISKTLYTILKRYQCGMNKYVLTGTEKYIEPRLYRKHYEKFIENNKLNYIKFHGLRHTFATRCIEMGADYKVVSELLGHASTNITMNLYVHPQIEQKRQCVELL